MLSILYIVFGHSCASLSIQVDYVNQGPIGSSSIRAFFGGRKVRKMAFNPLKWSGRTSQGKVVVVVVREGIFHHLIYFFLFVH